MMYLMVVIVLSIFWYFHCLSNYRWEYYKAILNDPSSDIYCDPRWRWSFATAVGLSPLLLLVLIPLVLSYFGIFLYG
jgi:hypothetical protein